jgi:hypothetical protein
MSLEELSLITSVDCDYDEDEAPIDVSNLKNLRKISWLGLGTESYIDTLREVITANSRNLTHLRIGSDGNWPSQASDEDGYDSPEEHADRESYCNNFFIRKVLGLGLYLTSKSNKFPALTSLSLILIPLAPTTNRLTQALDLN